MARSSAKKIEDLQGENTNLLNKLMKELRGFVKKDDASSKGGGKAVAAAAAGKKKEERQERAAFASTQNTLVKGYSKPGSQSVTGPFKFFGDLFDKISPEGDGKKEKEPKAPSWWTKLLMVAMVIIGGIWAFVEGLFSSGPLKGFFHLLGKVGVMGGLKMLVKIIGKTVSKTLKFIPVIG